jgi:hypothetical protein
MRRALVLAILSVVVSLTIGCGSDNGVPGFIPKGNFSLASLSGQYVYTVSGLDFSISSGGVPYRQAGVFTADGNGNITTSTDDFTEGSGISTTSSTGSYKINVDGTGVLNLNSALGSLTFAITMASNSKVYLIEGDSPLNAAGLAEKQDTSALSAAPTGTYAFLFHTIGGTSVGRIGVLTSNNGSLSGLQDINNSGSFSSPSITAGVLNTPSDPTIGRGTGSFTDNTTTHFNYYIVNANNIRFLTSDLGAVGIGRAEKQSGTPALSGSYAFGTSGDTASFLGGVNTVGRFTAGNAAITGGALDTVQDGNNAANAQFTGSFIQNGNGRATATFNFSGGTANEVIWMVSPSRGFMLVNDPNTVEDGTLDLQQSTSFSATSLNGQYAFLNSGFTINGAAFPLDRVGTFIPDGSGKLNLNETVNSSGNVTGGQVFSGTFQVSGNGRAMATINQVSLTNNDFVFYLISGTDAYVLQNDAGVQISGAISKQP